MKAITLHQPWASMISIGEKRIETRSWGTHYRGPLAIHASSNYRYINPRSKYYILERAPFRNIIRARIETWNIWENMFPIGCMIATCNLAWCKKIDDGDWFPANQGWWKNKHFWEASPREKALGDHSVGRYMWFLDNIQILDDPIPVKGKLGIWEFDEDAWFDCRPGTSACSDCENYAECN